MTSHKSNDSARSVRHRGASVLVVGGSVILALLVPSPASAAPLTIDPPSLDPFPSSTVTITGSKELTSTVRVPSLTGGDPYCIESGAQETWSCTFELGNGEHDVTVIEDLATDPPTSTQSQVRVRVLGAPDIATSGLTTGLIAGTGYPGAGIVVSATGPESFSGYACTTVQSPGGYWSCPLPVTASGEYDVTVQHTWPGTGSPGGSSTRTVTVDKEPPALPVVTQPTAGQQIGSQPVRFAGTGENGGRVDVFIGGVNVCSANVSGGQWSCTGTVGTGTHTVQAIQWDAAGNPSGATPGIQISVPSGGSTPPVPGPGPRPGGPGPPQPPTDPAQPQPTPTPTPTPSRTPQASPLFPPPIGGDSGLPPLDTWGTPTDYGAAVPVVSGASLLLGLALGAAFILLVALPLRLLANTLRGRIVWRRHRLAGRNRGIREEGPILNPWMTAAGALGAAILMAALAGGIQAEARYLRLAIAIGIALVVLNGVGIALAARLTGRAIGWLPGIRLVPLFLAVGALSAVISRGGGIQPPVIVGVVIGIVATGAAVSASGRVALAQLTTITALALGAWLAHSAMGPVDGFWASLTSETLAALCIASLGSVALLLLPVSGMPGQLLYDWSRAAWFGVALVAASLAAAVVASSPTFPLPWVLGGAIAFAVLSVAIWSWIRYVEPQLVAHDA